MKDARSYIVEEISPANIDLDAEKKISFTDVQVFAIVQRVLVDAEGYEEDARNKTAELKATRAKAAHLLGLQDVAQAYLDARRRLTEIIMNDDGPAVGTATLEELRRLEDLADALARVR